MSKQAAKFNISEAEISAVYYQGEDAVVELVTVALVERLPDVEVHLEKLENRQKKNSRNSSKSPLGNGFGKRTKSLRKNLLTTLNDTIEGLKDPRKPSNATRYSLKDVMLGGIRMFLHAERSFLDYQCHLSSRSGHDNAQGLFGMEKVPSVEQIRNLLGSIAASELFDVFESIYAALKAQGYHFEHNFGYGKANLIRISVCWNLELLQKYKKRRCFDQSIGVFCFSYFQLPLATDDEGKPIFGFSAFALPPSACDT